jgi:hypothetical protein
MARTHRSMRGVLIDMERMRNENARQPAVGNAKMNARGDVLGPNGQIVKTREEILAEYDKSNAKSVKQVSISDKSPLPDHFITPDEMIKRVQQQAKDAQAAQRVAQATTPAQTPFTPPAAPQPNITRTPISAEAYQPIPVTSQKLGEESGPPIGKQPKKRVILDKED